MASKWKQFQVRHMFNNIENGLVLIENLSKHVDINVTLTSYAMLNELGKRTTKFKGILRKRIVEHIEHNKTQVITTNDYVATQSETTRTTIDSKLFNKLVADGTISKPIAEQLKKNTIYKSLKVQAK